MTNRGRPRTRTDEASMFAIWRLVREEKDLRGAKSIRQACDRIMERGAVKFIDADKAVFDRVEAPSTKAASTAGELLRQRFLAAEKARKDSENYPILSQRATHYLDSVTGTRLRVAHRTIVEKAMAADGYARDGSTLPKNERKAFALEDRYIPRKSLPKGK